MSDDIDDKFFDASKLGSMVKRPNSTLEEVEANAGNLFYADGSDALANDGLVIGFEHVPSSKSVHFKAFIQSFNETYNSDWSEEMVYGRADPIRMFKQTSRSITISFIVPAATTGEGYENLGKIQKFISFLYPNYSDIGNALTISQSPLVRMKVMNLISNNTVTTTPRFRPSQSRTVARAFSVFNNTSSPWRDKPPSSYEDNVPGLLGAITNVSINHNLDNPDYGVFHLSSGTVIPKAIEISLDFKALHESPLGWREDQNGVNFNDKAFPYGTDLPASLAESGRGNKASLLAAQNEEAAAYTEGIRKQRQEEEDERWLQAAQDLAKAKLLKADGKTLNRRGERIARRLEAGKIRNPDKAAAYAGALGSVAGLDGAGVREVSKNAYETSEQANLDRKADRWEWIR